MRIWRAEWENLSEPLSIIKNAWPYHPAGLLADGGRALHSCRLEPVNDPVQAVVQPLPSQPAARLHVPRVVPDVVEVQLLGELRRAHRPLQVLLVRKDQPHTSAPDMAKGGRGRPRREQDARIFKVLLFKKTGARQSASF